MRTDRSIALDHCLVTAARMGDKSTLGRLAQRWQPKPPRHVRRLLGEDEQAREATQDAWLEILRATRNSEPSSSSLGVIASQSPTPHPA